MMPVVSVPSRPNGLPMASTFWPTCRRFGVAQAQHGEFSARSNLDQRQVALRVAGEDARLVAVVIGRVTSILPRPCRTWALVRIRPSELMKKPLPISFDG